MMNTKGAVTAALFLAIGFAAGVNFGGSKHLDKQTSDAEKIYYYGLDDGIEVELVAYRDHREYLSAVNGTQFLAGSETREPDNGYFIAGEVRLFSSVDYDSEDSSAKIVLENNEGKSTMSFVLPYIGGENGGIKAIPVDMVQSLAGDIERCVVTLDDTEHEIGLEIMERYK